MPLMLQGRKYFSFEYEWLKLSLISFCVSRLVVCSETTKLFSITDGSVCAFSDFNHDQLTDILVNEDNKILTVQVQDEEGQFQEYFKINIADSLESDIVSCAVADFNGDAYPDLLLTGDSNVVCLCYMHLNPNTDMYSYANSCKTIVNNLDRKQQPFIVDINSDGIADILYFDNEKRLQCKVGQSRNDTLKDCSDNPFAKFDSMPFNDGQSSIAHGFLDLDGDLSSELIFAVENREDKKILDFEVWQRANTRDWMKVDGLAHIKRQHLPEQIKSFGQPTFCDMNADGLEDVIIPICELDSCTQLKILIGKNQVSRIEWQLQSIDLQSMHPEVDDPTHFQFRSGDFTLDGFTDLVTILRNEESSKQGFPFLLENVVCPTGSQECNVIGRKFQLAEESWITSSEIAEGEPKLATFFDLKEDGNLDILVEFTKKGQRGRSYGFVVSESKGDTTFLKVEVFTNTCFENCSSVRHSDKQSQFASGISWNGAALVYTMTGTEGDEMRGAHTQLSQSSHKSLQLPFAVFGLGRSPNFVDKLTVGKPDFNASRGHSHSWFQLVPNSRMLIVPPKGGKNSWIGRLYMMPSQVIAKSALVLLSICAVMCVVIAFLHWRERRQDKAERQAQSHRFHFDAM